MAIFKLLLAMRLNGVWPDLPIRVVCLPYYFAAIFRFALHFAKEPITPPDGTAHRTARPGTPVNPVHLMIVVLACRVDGLHPFGEMWAATFWPMWLLFGLLVFASLGAGCLAIGILVTREPRERGCARSRSRPPRTPSLPSLLLSLPSLPSLPCRCREALRGPYRPTPLVPPRAPAGSGRSSSCATGSCSPSR